MRDSAVENAIAIRDDMAARIAEADARIKEWRVKMDRAERFIKDWQEFSGETVEVDPSLVPDNKSRLFPSGKPKNPLKEQVAAASCEILREHGEPMSRDDLFEALTNRGVIIHGKNPPVVLQTMLWRMQDVIVHLKGHGYWPRDDAYMAADYALDLDGPDQGDLDQES